MEQYPQFETPHAEQEHIVERAVEAHEQFEGTPSQEDSRKIVHDTIGKHIQQQKVDDPADLPDAFADLEDDKKQVEELVHIAFDRGIGDAVRVARTLRDPRVLDDFHDTLTDHFFDRLVVAGVIDKRE